MAISAVTPVQVRLPCYISGILRENFYGMGILAVTYCTADTAVMPLIGVMAGDALCIFCNVVRIRGQGIWFCDVVHWPVAYPARHASIGAIL